MVKIRVKIGAFNYWMSQKKDIFRFEGLKDNGDTLSASDGVRKIALIRSKYPNLTFKIESLS
jgi:hypothetical protein